MMLRHSIALFIAATFVAGLLGCSTEPKTADERANLADEANVELRRIKQDDPSLDAFLSHAHAYAIFPSVGKGAVGLCGAYGHGLVYRNGEMIGYTDLRQATIGLQLGGQTYTEVIAFETPEALKNFQSNSYAFSANASAVAIKSGAAATAKYENGVAVFTSPRGGLMFEASIGGQEFTYTPKGSS